MSYADRDTSGSRVVAIILVSLIVAGFGYAFVTGLAMSIAKKAAEKLNTFDVAPPPPPPPPDKPPPPPPDQPNLPPPPTQVTAPPIKLDVPPPNNTYAAPPNPLPPPISPPAPPAPVAPPAPPAPPRIATPVSPRGNQAGWFPQDSYPAAAKRAGAAGRVSVTVNVGTDGRVSGCTVISSSGNADLDSTTCNLARRNGRFNPAKDANGTPVASTFALRGILWKLEDE
jgi:protein TonB